MKKDLSNLSPKELENEKLKRLENIQDLDKLSFDPRQKELYRRLMGNIAKIEALIKEREE